MLIEFSGIDFCLGEIGPLAGGFIESSHLHARTKYDVACVPGQLKANTRPCISVRDGEFDTRKPERPLGRLLQTLLVSKDCFKGVACKLALDTISEVLIAFPANVLVQDEGILKCSKGVRKNMLAVERIPVATGATVDA